MQIDLNLTHPREFAGRPQVSVETLRRGSTLILNFHVKNSPIHVNSVLPVGESAWGLWETDVVELFLAAPGPDINHYYEFQVSPTGQHFELEILQPRKTVNQAFRSGFKHSAQQISDREWTASMEIDLAVLKLDTALELRGGIFSCLGSSAARLYLSAFIPFQDPPDFHRPDLFQNLV